jgi:YD repeat-containing protein
MKRLICLAIMAAMLLMLFSCGDTAKDNGDAAQDSDASKGADSEENSGSAAPEGEKNEQESEQPTEPAPPAEAAGSCEFVGKDETTRGEWVGNYGGEGYLVLSNDDAEQLPAYASIEFLDPNDNPPPHHVWYQESTAEESDLSEEALEDIARRAPGALYTDPSKTDRAASCFYNGDTVYLNIDIGSETKYVTVYSLDWDEQGRETEITVYDGSGKVKLVPAMEISEFSGGVYVKFKVSGSVCLEYFNLTSGQNAVIGAVFFDSIG